MKSRKEVIGSLYVGHLGSFVKVQLENKFQRSHLAKRFAQWQDSIMMRPDTLTPLFAKTESLEGIGPQLAKKFERLGLRRVIDLIWHLPVKLDHYPLYPTIAATPYGKPVAFPAEIGNHMASSSRAPYKITVFDNTDQVDLLYFNAVKPYLLKRFPPGEKRIITGTIEIFGGSKQLTHPPKVAPMSLQSSWQEYEPVYPLTLGLPNFQLISAIKKALRKLPELKDWISESELSEKGWPTIGAALQKIHAPRTEAELFPEHPLRKRLAYDELLADQLAQGLLRKYQKRQESPLISPSTQLRKDILETFQHPLTQGQLQVLKEIDQDLSSGERMIRLLQGDVGSGKTMVGLLAMASALESGFQAAFLAPTEILARQQFETIKKLMHGTNLRIELLMGNQKGRKNLLEDIAQNKVNIVIGTHALLQDDVLFSHLALVVIDEQHRFGVEQRLKLTRKGKCPHILVMTATPIPRTLMLTNYGDLEASRLLEKPKGRLPIDTRVFPAKRLEDIADGLQRVIDQGGQAYWVCPLVEESETLDLSAATERFEHLKSLYGEGTVGLVHGKMKSPEKDAVMEKFRGDKIQILVATTVIEVGVDVPNANVIVIEHAERFGLAQLHQLRGRVGRGEKPSSCLLIYSYPISEIGHARLSIMKDSNDGFRIAEEDLRLRGGGDLLGLRQSGLPSYRIADPLFHTDLLEMAHAKTQEILETNPHLKSEAGERLRTLLYLFGKDQVVHTLSSG
ncbi:ATP-dependent DNA helicase RecG [Candidatus Bealeia paramacronuclearis]